MEDMTHSILLLYFCLPCLHLQSCHKLPGSFSKFLGNLFLVVCHIGFNNGFYSLFPFNLFVSQLHTNVSMVQRPPQQHCQTQDAQSTGFQKKCPCSKFFGKPENKICTKNEPLSKQKRPRKNSYLYFTIFTQTQNFWLKVSSNILPIETITIHNNIMPEKAFFNSTQIPPTDLLFRFFDSYFNQCVT